MRTALPIWRPFSAISPRCNAPRVPPNRHNRRLTAWVPHARVQSLALQQGPLLRKLRLASVAVHTTQALAVNAALHLDADAARALLFAEAERARSGKLDGLFSSAE